MNVIGKLARRALEELGKVLNVPSNPYNYRTAMVQRDGAVFKAGTVVSVRVWGKAGDKYLFSCRLGACETVLREDFLTDFRSAPYEVKQCQPN